MLVLAQPPAWALNCVAERLDGTGKLDWSAYAGRHVYLDFWASWCEPCKKSFPFMNDLKKQFEAKGIVVVAISVDKDATEAREFLRANPAAFQVALDSTGQCAKEMQVKGMPSSFILGPKGELIDTHKGFRPSDIASITQALQKLSENR